MPRQAPNPQLKNYSNTHWGYYDWLITHPCGSTPEFAWGGTRALVQSSLTADDEGVCFSATKKILAQLARYHPRLRNWCDQIDVLSTDTGSTPLLLGWQSLQAALDVSCYPHEITNVVNSSLADGISKKSTHHPREYRFHTACPYDAFVSQGLQLIGILFGWAYTGWKQGKLHLPRDQLQKWCRDFDQLSMLLPSVEVRALHHHLWQVGVHWQWLGGETTRIRQGAHQRVVVGWPKDLSLANPDAWRVPIYTVTGSVGKTTTARLLWQLLQDGCDTVALTASDGAWIGQKRVAEGDCIGGVSARSVLTHPTVQAAVFEQGRGGIINQGVPYAHSDVAILLNVQAVHLGVDNIDTIEQMANTKAVGLRPADLWVLNYDDLECRRLGSERDAEGKIWFSICASQSDLQSLSKDARAAVGVTPELENESQEILICERGELTDRISLTGVAPYHGLLGKKTLEELLVVIAAVRFGPMKLPVRNWAERLQALRLDSENHVFRTSMHSQENAVFVLDKAAEHASIQFLEQAIKELAEREGCTYKIAALCRSAGEPPERHLESIDALYRFIDEFICFDRPDTYTTAHALPIYRPGSIPVLLRDRIFFLNHESGMNKLVTVLDDWQKVEVELRKKLANFNGKALILINQPSTASTELNRSILAFATRGLQSA